MEETRQKRTEKKPNENSFFLAHPFRSEKKNNKEKNLPLLSDLEMNHTK